MGVDKHVDPYYFHVPFMKGITVYVRNIKITTLYPLKQKEMRILFKNMRYFTVVYM